MYPHRIRLRGPWKVELRKGPQNECVTAHWSDEGLPIWAGLLRFRRHFGYPGRIDDYERVWVTFAGIEGSAVVQLNGSSLGKLDKNPQNAEFDVTGHLQGRNELVIDVEAEDDAGGLWGEVALEVRCTAY